VGNYLVTGVAGFIGAAVAAALIRKGHEVTGLDNLSTGFSANIPQGVAFFEGNCQDKRLYTETLAGRSFDAIFHIAGQSSGEVSFDDPVSDLRANTESTLHLLTFAAGTGCARFIYASSMSVYGLQPDAPVRESAPLAPQSFYGVGKLAGEHYTRLYGQYGVGGTCLRLFNVYGPGQNMGNMRQGMVSIFMSMMLKDGHIHVKGSPDRFRDFVYIDDVVAAFLACLERPDSVGKELNIGGSGKIPVGNLVDRLRRLSPSAVTVEYAGTTAGDLHGICADGSLARACLGYSPKIPLDEGLARMYAWCGRRGI
jgi:UDP-glucose 4-epimerase